MKLLTAAVVWWSVGMVFMILTERDTSWLQPWQFPSDMWMRCLLLGPIAGFVTWCLFAILVTSGENWPSSGTY